MFPKFRERWPGAPPTVNTLPGPITRRRNILPCRNDDDDDRCTSVTTKQHDDTRDRAGRRKRISVDRRK